MEREPEEGQPAGYVRTPGPDPAQGWNKSRHGIGAPFRPGVPRPPGRRMIIARYADGGEPVWVDVHDAGRALVAVLRHNPYSKWAAREVDPAGWVSVHHTLRHYRMNRYPFTQWTLVDLIETDN
eukprot:14683354-Alexandrium_andersonii.AAC.1